MINRILAQFFPKNRFFRAVSVLAGGSAASQLILVISAPLLTRLYSPEDFGLLAVYVGILSLCLVIASLRYELAIPLQDDDDRAIHVVLLSLIVVLITTTGVGFMLYFFGDLVAENLGTPKLAYYIWLIPVGLLFAGVYQVFNYWAIRQKQFLTISKTRIQQSLVSLFIQLLFFKVGGLALIFGQAISQGLGSLALAKSALTRKSNNKTTWRDIVYVAIRYKNFPLFSTWSGVFNVAGQQLPPLMFAALFGASSAGLYSLAHRVLAMPMSLVGKAIGSVFFSSAADAHRDGRLGQLVHSVQDKLAQIAMPPVILLTFIAPELFSLVFGENWINAGELARWMAPWLYMVFITAPLSTLFDVLEKQLQGVIFQTILLFARIGAIAVGATIGDLLLTVILFSCVSAICWMGFLVWISIMSGNNTAILIKSNFKAILISLSCTFPIWLFLLMKNQSPYLWFLACFMSCFLIAVHYLMLFRRANHE